MNDPLLLIKQLNPLSTEELAASAPSRIHNPPDHLLPATDDNKVSARRTRRTVLGTLIATVALVGVGGTTVAVCSQLSDVEPDFSTTGPVVTERIAPSDARWANPGEPELNLQAPLIHTVFRKETRTIPLPPGATYKKVYGKWIAGLTSPGMTQHTRTEIRAEATHEALNSWFRFWLSATPAQRKATSQAMKQVTTSPYLDRTLGEPIGDADSERVRRILVQARAGNPGPMREWLGLPQR